MLRALILGTAFFVVSPSIRGYFFNGVEAVDKILNQHTTAAMVFTGFAVFCGFLAFQLSSSK